MAAAAAVLAAFPGMIAGAYVAAADPANAALVALARQFLLIAALFQIVDGHAGGRRGALRGYEDTAMPMVYAAIGATGDRLFGGWILAFALGLGPVGLWWAFVLGLGAVAALLDAAAPAPQRFRLT